MNIKQEETLFWGGPLHGEMKRLLGGMYYVPVLVPLENTFIPNDYARTTTEVMFRTERYNIHQFTWHWKTGWYSGFVMVLSPASYLIVELEGVLNVLGGLWGGEPSGWLLEQKKRKVLRGM